MVKLAGLFVLVVGLVIWVLLASTLLDSLRGGQHASILTTVTATATATATSAAAEPSPTALAEPSSTPTPAPTLVAATPTGTVVAQQTYRVAPGDNLTKIAKTFGITIEALQEANHITDPASLQAGQTLVIPAP